MEHRRDSIIPDWLILAICSIIFSIVQGCGHDDQEKKGACWFLIACKNDVTQSQCNAEGGIFLENATCSQR